MRLLSNSFAEAWGDQVPFAPGILGKLAQLFCRVLAFWAPFKHWVVLRCDSWLRVHNAENTPVQLERRPAQFRVGTSVNERPCVVFVETCVHCWVRLLLNWGWTFGEIVLRAALPMLPPPLPSKLWNTHRSLDMI